ncbi:M23 family metallopeptidase [Microvirga brassicacearum]|uniref:M23 family metallopeptidase n=1 Tax=Microvirga brassicacearum TaxID=2580413 RepID=A0A5N3P5T3_9HYPH|nr:M23 family metallopeptidase [Microvirga brassicacearum]
MILGLLAAAFLSPAAMAQDISLRLPVACEVGKTCFIQHYVDRDPSTAAKDFQCGSLTYDGHDGTDIRIPTMAAQKAGVAVLAAADGKVLRGRDGVADVSIAESDRASVGNRECGNGVVIDHGQGFETQYCHMAKGSLSVRPGDDIKAGDQIGRVGLSGMTEFPHLHFTLRRDGKVVDPFAFGAEANSCGGGRSLWDAKTASMLSYRAGDVLNQGFADGPVTMAAVESGAIEQTVPSARSPALVAYVRAIGLKGGDAQFLTLVDPDGKTLAENKPAALDRDKAQWMLFSGIKAPSGGFRPGLYRAHYKVTRDGKTAIEQAFAIDLKP